MADSNEQDNIKHKSPNKNCTVKKPRCYHCNKFGHLTFNCTLSKLNCHRCGLSGHYFWDCDKGPTNVGSFDLNLKKVQTLADEPSKEDEKEREGNGYVSCVEEGVDVIEVDPMHKGPCSLGLNVEKPETLPVELTDGDGKVNEEICKKRVNEIEFDSMQKGQGLNLEKKNKANGGVVCVKRREDVKKVEEDEDCFILDFDPTEISKGVNCEKEGDKGIKKWSSIVSVKKREDVKKVEQVEDCFILEFDPDEPVKFNSLSLSVCESDSLTLFEDEVTLVAEKGQVACRDFPHPRHLCAKYPFKKTSHSYYCEKCYCYICDIPAPCAKWTWIEGPMHCHATDEESMWKNIKQTQKKI